MELYIISILAVFKAQYTTTIAFVFGHFMPMFESQQKKEVRREKENDMQQSTQTNVTPQPADLDTLVCLTMYPV